jgi:uncharacterized protein with HEPN domain
MKNAGFDNERLLQGLKRVLAAAILIESYLDGLTREDFLEDRRTQDAVCMNILTLGENAAKLLTHFEDQLNTSYGEIEWKAMRGMRNRMAHGYEETDFELVWDTVKTYIPNLVAKLKERGI